MTRQEHRAALSILLIDDSAIRAQIVEDGLRAAGYRAIERIGTAGDLKSAVHSIDPDIVIIDLEDPSRDVIEQIFHMSRSARRPVAMFVDQTDQETIDAAIDAGVSAYVVNGLSKDRVRPIVETAISRFSAFEKLRRELDEAKTALAERRVIERAKGLIMESKGLSEDEAYKLLRRTAMNEKRPLADIANAVLIAAKISG